MTRSILVALAGIWMTDGLALGRASQLNGVFSREAVDYRFMGLRLARLPFSFCMR